MSDNENIWTCEVNSVLNEGQVNENVNKVVMKLILKLIKLIVIIYIAPLSILQYSNAYYKVLKMTDSIRISKCAYI
jgi:hypothetical protein